MKSLLSFITIILLTPVLYAQDVDFRAKAPNIVRTDEPFQLTYEVNEEGSNFESGDLSEFTVLGGPSRGSRTSMTLINGQFTQSTTISYTYTLAAKEEGTYTISPGRITVGGETYETDPVTIKVVENTTQQNNTQATTTQEITDEDVFVRVETNKRSAYKGEAVVAAIKLYTRVPLRDLRDLSFPQFDGFWREQIEMGNRRVEWKKETVNGEIYNAGIIAQFVLIPQETGKQTIEPIDMEIIALQEVRQQRRGRNHPFFDDFFNQRGYQPVTKNLKSPATDIEVKDIPASADFTGDFDISTDISKTEVDANESVSMKVTLSGKGNLKMINPPAISFPPDFESFEPETVQDININTSGISGDITFEYLFIPRHAGTYEIPSVTLNAFNPSTGKVEKLSTESYEIRVNKGDGSGGITGMDYSQKQEDISFVGKDIRYIKTGDFSLEKEASTFLGSTPFYMSYLLGTGAFLALFVFMRQKRKNREDEAGYKRRKAGNIARKRLKVAEKHMKEDNSARFYEELLHGIWGYLEDKLNLNKSDLTRNKIRNELSERQVSQETSDKMLNIMEKCEMARYAPGSTGSTLSEDYQESVDVISSMEEELKA